MLASVQDWLLSFICVSSVAGMVGCMGLSLSRESDNSEQEKIDRVNEALRATGLKVKNEEFDSYVIVTNARISEGEEIYFLHIPQGLSFQELEKKKDILENTLKKKIQLIKNDNFQYFLKIKEEKQLESKYPFEVVQVENKNELQIAVGMTCNGPLVANLSSNSPHVLIGATSGSGKSRLVKSILLQVMENYTSSQLQLCFLDNKGGVEGNSFLNCEHFECITNSIYETVDFLDMLSVEMESRLSMIRKANVTNIVDFNKKNKKNQIPFKLVVLDELYPFLALKDKQKIYENLADLLSRGRAVGIHFIISTQKTTTDVLPSFISANTSMIIGMRVRNEQESKNVLGHTGLEKIQIKGRGICLMEKEVEFQSFWVNDETIDRFCLKHRKKNSEFIQTEVKSKDLKIKKEEKTVEKKSKLL